MFKTRRYGDCREALGELWVAMHAPFRVHACALGPITKFDARETGPMQMFQVCYSIYKSLFAPWTGSCKPGVMQHHTKCTSLRPPRALRCFSSTLHRSNQWPLVIEYGQLCGMFSDVPALHWKYVAGGAVEKQEMF